MKFSDFAKYLEKLEKTTSRIEITKILAELFKKADSKEIDKIVYLSLGTLAPPYRSIVFNIAERMMIAVLAQAYKADRKKVLVLYKRLGDLGSVAQKLAQNSKLKTQNSKLSVSQVYEKLLGIAKDEGEGSQERKISNMAKLLSELNPLSTRFVARIPVGRLRLGFSDKTILDALSWMQTGDKRAKSELEKAYHVLPDVGLLAKNVKKLGIKKATKGVRPKVGVPVLPMLAQRLKSPAEMIEKMEEVVVEPKFDGLRIQLHFRKKGFRDNKGSKVKAFTRNLNENSWMFPEVKGIHRYIKAKEVILDTEAIGVDEERRALADFQATMTRRRKHKIEEISAKIPIKFYVFDILYKDGRNLMDIAYLERRKELAKVIKSGNLLQVVDYIVTRDPKDIMKQMSREVSEGMEGIIVKRADSRYVPGRTGWRWVKMKEEEKAHAKLADTIDCIVMGYTAGKGKRAEFGVGQFLVGVLDPPAGGKIRTVTKIGTGVTDEQFRELKTRLERLEVGKKPKEYDVHKDLEPDYWVRPSLVVEIAADEITKSPKHSAGYAFRFPRLIKFRDDKSPTQATTLKEAKRFFKLQKS